ncbi:MAG: nickel pincer cofactor biosynthesis protein LarB [Oscillospiraceae bacterium]|nr:nickel pincer cofactor biosynthesis protein LarB [Oscillospiraceae bacterium]
MEKNKILEILKDVAEGKISAEKAFLEIKQEPFKDIGFASVDLHRSVRNGAGEVIYGAGKTAGQISEIIKTMHENGSSRVLVTRLTKEKAEIIKNTVSLMYDEISGIGITGDLPVPDGAGRICIISAGTSDMPVAEEAALTAEFLGNEVIRIYDAGVAGIHRLFARLDDIMSASVIVAVAGMEGALASVVGGLADCPVIAVPTSVGYGASFGGLSALLSMLNSCSSGVSVVNIDNGFGAAYQASLINHLRRKNENTLS